MMEDDVVDDDADDGNNVEEFLPSTADKLPPSVKRAEHQLFQVQDRWFVLLSYNWYFSVVNSTLVYAITKLHIHM